MRLLLPGEQQTGSVGRPMSYPAIAREPSKGHAVFRKRTHSGIPRRVEEGEHLVDSCGIRLSAGVPKKLDESFPGLQQDLWGMLVRNGPVQEQKDPPELRGLEAIQAPKQSGNAVGVLADASHSRLVRAIRIEEANDEYPE